MEKRCGTCAEASSTQLPVSEVCSRCHDYSMWCQAVPEEKTPIPKDKKELVDAFVKWLCLER